VFFFRFFVVIKERKIHREIEEQEKQVNLDGLSLRKRKQGAQ